MKKNYYSMINWLNELMAQPPYNASPSDQQVNNILVPKQYPSGRKSDKSDD